MPHQRPAMPISNYVKSMRGRVGHDLLLLPGVAAIIKNDRGQILVHRRADNGDWSLPAGAVDPGETPAEAIEREVREETGFVARAVRVLGVVGGPPLRVRYPNGDEAEYTAVVFECTVTGGKLAAKDGEATAFRWADPAEMRTISNGAYPTELFVDNGPAETWFQRTGV
jgi:8-oxo-dGTP pyrophosphatase MutT (NUDIX family)